MIEKNILDNGIPVYIDRVSNVDTIGIAIVPLVGSIYEPKELRGISHFLEHMMFKSNKKYSSKQIFEKIELSGGAINAFTNTFYTAYIVEILKNNFEVAVDVLFSMFENNRYIYSEFTKEKQIILSEIQLSCAPEVKLLDLIPKACYGGSDYGDPILGYKETVENISLEDIENFKYNTYNPDNIIIILSGDVNENHIQILNKYFGKLEERISKLKRPSKKEGNNIFEKHPGAETIYYSKNYSFNVDLHELLALCIFAGGGGFAPLFKIVRDKYGLSYSPHFGITYEYPNEEFILSFILESVSYENFDKMESAFIDFLDLVHTSKDLFEKSKNYIEFIYKKNKKNIFRRLSKEIPYILLYKETYDDFYKKLLKIEFDNIIENVLLKLNKPKKVCIYKEELFI